MTLGWFADALRLRQLPGDQLRAGGVWRCETQTF